MMKIKDKDFTSKKKRTKNEKNNYRRKTKRFTFTNGTLLYNHKTHGCVRVIKETERDIILQGCHSDPLAGHQGINRTTFKVKEQYYWPGLEADIRDYIRHCDKCQRLNCLAKASAELHPIPVKDSPFDMLGLDLVGPLNTTDNNDRFIAVLIDYFTKWPEVKTIPSKHSHHIAEFIIEVICRHGTPSEVITGRGR
ncbi:unnamed protein product [Mytilus coruscus]|uniref:Integrase catalytic domain-containing protein n=1 Tax=Mytilus coruscus TaxID=42192 RepID=A0A6J8CMK8_MYTCO|nr:unnamed protein product [Mytilus coruscus]